MFRHLAWRVLLVAACCGLAAGCASNGRVVERLTVVNRTRYDLEVRVTDGTRDGWVLLGRVHRGATTVNDAIDDLGDVWIFRFDYAGRVRAGELRVDRTELARNRWTVEIPPTVDERLRAEGIDPSPER